MATSSRQKSFFDQDHSKRSEARHWQNRRNNGNVPCKDGQQQQQPPQQNRRAPIPPLPQSRAVLQSFALSEDTLQTPRRGSGKENMTMVSPTRKPVPRLLNSVSEPPTFIPPSTPAVRLPLADLLGITDDGPRRGGDKEASPEDHIGWAPGPHYYEATPGHARKRANSSSPAMTLSQTETSAHFEKKRALDLEEIKKVLQTPKTDPASDLWSRYNGSEDSSDASGPKLHSLVQLLADASPKSAPRTPGGSVNGLRRWSSCGTAFPASRAKRRRTDVPVRQIQVDDAKSNASRLSEMIDTIHANLAQVRTQIEQTRDPSSSSPFPDKNSFERAVEATSNSPISGGPRVRETASRDVEAAPVPGMSRPAVPAATPLKTSQSSDYGDDDVDLDDLDLDAAIGTAKYTPRSRTGAEEAEVPLKNDNQKSSRNDSGHTMDHRQSLVTIVEDDDEFGEDDDLTAEDIETAFSQPPPAMSTTRGAKGTPRSIPRPQAVQQHTTSDDEDEFGGMEVDDAQFAAAELAATQALQSSRSGEEKKHKTTSRRIQRYLVQGVVSGTYRDERGFQQQEKILAVHDERRQATKSITLRQSWLDTHCKTGAFVHVVGRFSNLGHITIDDSHNLLIVHPDHLVSSTAVADSFDCLRKAVLQDRVKATSVTSKATVYGSILHELFQIAIQHNRWDVEWLRSLVGDLTIKYVEGLFEAGAKDLNEATEFLASKLPELSSWATRFVQATPDGNAKVQDRNGKTIGMSITKLLDVEEHVWSPTYGLKGNIDATVEVCMDDDAGRRALTVPLEVKTGKYQSAAHRAQTALYTLLLSDRYDIDVQYGILYYMENSTMSRIPAIRNELRHMVMQRNELASYVRERLSLPPMLKNEFKCGRCYAKTACFLYHKLAEDGTQDTAGVGAKFNQIVSKLKPIHQDFFKKWDELLTKEETVMFRFKRELWTMLSHERAKLGRCFAEVIIETGSASEDQDAQKINRFVYTFVKRDAGPGFSFAESQITVGEPIVVSSEQGHFALANGYVTKISASRIGVAVDRRLHNARIRKPGFDEDSNQCFAAIMDVRDGDVQSPAFKAEQPGHEVVYRLDKDEFSNGMAMVRNNLLSIMDDSIFRACELRELIIQNKPPVFKPSPTAYTLSGPASQIEVNAGQRAAIDKIMSAQDYALVLGMPGTGKTTTIAHIIRALVARGKSVLLTSYTHTAVDNILLKLRQDAISVLRLGVQAKVHPEVQQFATMAAIPRASIAELEEMYMTPQVVATTCLGVNHQIFHKRVFDYCIVDEASQITLPVCLGPIRMARTFVLVGDHYQLPPLVQNKDAQEGGLDVSLFKLLSDRQPGSVVDLDQQYRMCSDIMQLSSALIYSGRLHCGNAAVAARKLLVPKPEGLQALHTDVLGLGLPGGDCASEQSADCLLREILEPAAKVVFVNTDRIQSGKESLVGSRITNAYEVSLLNLLATGLLAQGIGRDQVGVITFYRSQLAALRQSFRGHSIEGIEMHTADKFQGRDKEVILLSCVRSNTDGIIGELLRDWRRVNVAITRARSKFILVGSRRTLETDELWKRLIGVVEQMHGVIEADESLLNGHLVETGSPAIGTSGPSSGWGAPDQSQIKTEASRTLVLSPSKSAANRGRVLKTARKPSKQGKVGQEQLLRNRPISQNIVAILSQ